MTESIGKALASAIKEPAAIGQDRHGRHIFRNPHRRAAFSFLTMAPGTGLAGLALTCGISQNTAKWHVDRLIKSGYAVKHPIGRAIALFPVGQVDHRDVRLFHFLNNPGRGEAYRKVMRAPGLSQTEISEAMGDSRQTIARILKTLEGEGLLSVVSDGPHSRYYPTGLLAQRADGFYSHSKGFSAHIIKKLELEGGRPPTIIKKDPHRILIEMGHASDRFTMEVGINPFMTCNVC